MSGHSKWATIKHKKGAADHEGRAVLARSGAVWVSSFHPELSGDLRVHERFLSTTGGER